MGKIKKYKKKQQDIISMLLLPGHYLRQTTNHASQTVYKCYKDNQVPVTYFPAIAFMQISYLTKEDTHKRITISRQSLRQLDGRSVFKKIYRRSRV